MTRPREYDLGVPLHLIPVTVAERIRERGGNLYRISIVRTSLHHYTIKCTCRAKIAMEPFEKTGGRSRNQETSPLPEQSAGVDVV
jgi:hypothetical protein